MSTYKDKLEFKYRQAEFFSGRIDPNALFEAACFLSAFACAIRAIFQQAEKALRQPGEKKCWVRVINPWMAKLSADENEALRVLTNIRNEDIHVEAIEPSAEVHSMIDILDILSLTPPFSSKLILVVADPQTKIKHHVRGICDIGLRAARKLINEYPTL
jgi:hypothetical protein